MQVHHLSVKVSLSIDKSKHEELTGISVDTSVLAGHEIRSGVQVLARLPALLRGLPSLPFRTSLNMEPPISHRP